MSSKYKNPSFTKNIKSFIYKKYKNPSFTKKYKNPSFTKNKPRDITFNNDLQNC
jgi:hypothetical protein